MAKLSSRDKLAKIMLRVSEIIGEAMPILAEMPTKRFGDIHCINI